MGPGAGWVDVETLREGGAGLGKEVLFSMDGVVDAERAGRVDVQGREGRSRSQALLGRWRGRVCEGKRMVAFCQTRSML